MLNPLHWIIHWQPSQGIQPNASWELSRLDGFLKFVEYFVDHRGLLGALIETKVTILLGAIAKKYVS